MLLYLIMQKEKGTELTVMQSYRADQERQRSYSLKQQHRTAAKASSHLVRVKIADVMA